MLLVVHRNRMRVRLYYQIVSIREFLYPDLVGAGEDRCADASAFASTVRKNQGEIQLLVSKRRVIEDIQSDVISSYFREPPRTNNKKYLFVAFD